MTYAFETIFLSSVISSGITGVFVFAVTKKVLSIKIAVLERTLMTYSEDQTRRMLQNTELQKELDIEKAKKHKLSIEASQILHDLTAEGSSVIRITPINPSDLFWRSPR